MDYPKRWLRFIARLEKSSDEWDEAYIAGASREELHKLQADRDSLLMALGLAVWHDIQQVKQDSDE